MTNIPDPSQPEKDRPVQVEGVPQQEGISEADAADRLDEVPEEQENRQDPVQSPGSSDED